MPAHPTKVYLANEEDITYHLVSKALGQIPVSKAIDMDVDAVLNAITRRVHKVVVRAGRGALASAVQRAPVRHVFKGGRRGSGPRYYTLKEAKMELPSFLRTEPRRPYTPDEVAAAWLKGRSLPATKAMNKKEALAQLRATPIATSRNRAQNWQKTGQRDRHYPNHPAPREVSEHLRTGELYLTDRGFEGYLTTRGKYDLKHGRGISVGLGARSARRFESEADVNRVKSQLDSPGNVAEVGHLGGSLRRSIHTERRDRDIGPKVSIVAGGDDAPYARFVEFGTRHAAAQPFLRPALKHAEAPFKTMMRDAFPGSR